MKIAVLYDVHGNLPALDAVLAEMRRERVDQIVFGGDIVPGPMPKETLARVLSVNLPVRFLKGNGDREAVSWKRGVESSAIPASFAETFRWVARDITREHEQAIDGWPPSVRMAVEGIGDVFFCHATSRNDTEIFTKRTAEQKLRPVFDPVNAALVVCGHTHMQFDRMVGHTRVVNAGSVGMPFGEPGAYWLMLDRGVQLRKTSYDLNAAADVIRAAPYPDRANFIDRNLLKPPTEEEMLERFSRAELA